MNGMDKILERISGDAQAQADQILADARDQADQIRQRWAQQGRQEAQDILERGRLQAQRHGERMDSSAQLECRKQVLAAKQEVIEEAFQRALEKLCALPREDYVAVLSKLAAQASTTGREKLIFSPVDRNTVGKEVAMAANQILGDGGLTLSEECREMRGGFVLSDGAVEVNCSFAALLRAQRQQLTGQVAALLFP